MGPSRATGGAGLVLNLNLCKITGQGHVIHVGALVSRNKTACMSIK